MVTHYVTVMYQATWREFVAGCTCGWAGSYFGSKALAEREGDMHKADPDHPPYKIGRS